MGVTVTGGAAGIAADCAQLTALAGRFGAAATDAFGAAAGLHGYLVGPAVLGSALLDPAGYAAFEAELLWALDGWQGVTWAAGECGALDVELRSAAGAYRQVDRLGTSVHDAVLGSV